jgi:phosphocarrier protein FPr
MAGDPTGAVLLVGLGADELSMGPASFGSVKRAVGARSLEELQSLARHALALGSSAAVRDLVAHG